MNTTDSTTPLEADARRNRPGLALARVEVDGETRWVVRNGETYSALGMSLSELLRLPQGQARAAVEAAAGDSEAATAAGGIRPTRVLAPVDPHHEVWGAGVTYLRSRDGRIEEATDGDPYDRVYIAERPELFFKSVGARVVASGEPIGVRADSAWNAPEPELGIVLDARGELFGYLPGDDVSSRTIEGDNLLYLPQAKIYTASCALGPEIVPAWTISGAVSIALTVMRDGGIAFEGTTTTDEMARSFDEIADWLFQGLDFTDGVIVLTGTGVVPGADFTLLPGDEVTVDVAHVGTLVNPVIGVGRREGRRG